MRIASVKVENYKSFLVSEEIHFEPGFNVIVGQNNVGKTALVEALSLQFDDKPHRSLKTTDSHSHSQVHISFEFSKDELIEFGREMPILYVPVRGNQSNDRSNFIMVFSESRFVINCVFGPSSNVYSVHLQGYYVMSNIDLAKSIQSLQFTIDQSGDLLEKGGTRSVKVENTFEYRLAKILHERIYTFSAERLNVGRATMGVQKNLHSNASNLAQVLNLLQSSNVSRFERLNKYIRTVFPQIKQITARPISENQACIYVWTIEPDTEREDLAVSLSDSGTGIGQVLAILYVVITSDYPRTIIIDEPQSFLHPGAVRKLFDILKQHPQHQYIITTHSPTVVTSADPHTLFLVRKEAEESTIETLEVAETQKLRLFLAEVGARPSDVFGADNILWVEGRTEELCFPVILSKVVKDPPILGTAILGVIQTGDFTNKKHSKTIFEIYERLSKGCGLLPPAIGFIFDKEGRSEREREDLIRQSKGTVFFTPRRMYENYLLNPQAIASVMTDIEGFRDNYVTAEKVETWLQRNRWHKKYFEKTISEHEQTDEIWISSVHGAKVIEDLFKEFSENRVEYDKIAYGVALTRWIVENAPDDLVEIAELIKKVLTNPETQKIYPRDDED
jgi:predicted ATPase